jgi:plastocyanin
MRHRVRTGALVLGSLAMGSGPAAAQDTHEIRMVADARRGEYRFVPSQVTARPGDVLVFVAVSGAPHSVVFEAKGLSEAAHQALNAALPQRSADLSSPLVTRNGAEYRITVPALPKGDYGFFCLPHRAYDMRGQLRVK